MKSKSAFGDRLPRGFWPLASVCAAVLVLGAVLQYAMPGGFPLVKQSPGAGGARQRVTEIHSRGPLRINEIMTANGGALTDASGSTPDWIEIANIGSRAVSLKGYVLARSAKAGNVFVFPDLVLQPEACAIVFADGYLQAEVGEELHAPFRLSSAGDVLMLFNPTDVAIDTVNIPALAENTVYARETASRWEVSASSTPGALNAEAGNPAEAEDIGAGPIQIAELMSSSAHYAPDENGVCHDYILLRNTSGADVDVGGWYLSDNRQLPYMWRFPAGTVIPAGDVLRVHCSGLNRIGDPEHLHTSFKLSSEGEQAVLSNAAGQLADVVSFDLLRTDVAYVRGDDGSWTAGEPTVDRAS